MTIAGESCPSNKLIHDRDLSWLRECDIVVARITIPSHGVGYEIAKAEEWGKPILCLYRRIEDKPPVTAMITGSELVVCRKYKTFEELREILDRFLSDKIH